MTDAELLERFTEISQTNLFPVQFGDGTMLTGLPPNDIYQLGFFASFNECHLAVREYVDQMLVKGILDQQREARKLSRKSKSLHKVPKSGALCKEIQPQGNGGRE